MATHSHHPSLTYQQQQAKFQRRIHPHIRWMVRRDYPEVQAIENASFAEPWCEDQFIRFLRMRNVIGIVAEYDERVVGQMVYGLEKTFIHVITLVVHPEFRLRGIGHALIMKLLGKLSYARRRSLVFDVPAENLDGQLFLRSCGMKAIKVLAERAKDDVLNVSSDILDPRALGERYRFVYDVLPGEV